MSDMIGSGYCNFPKKKHFEFYFFATKRLSRIEKNHKFLSLVFIARGHAQSVLKSIFIFWTLTPNVYVYSGIGILN